MLKIIWNICQPAFLQLKTSFYLLKSLLRKNYKWQVFHKEKIVYKMARFIKIK